MPAACLGRRRALRRRAAPLVVGATLAACAGLPEAFNTLPRLSQGGRVQTASAASVSAVGVQGPAVLGEGVSPAASASGLAAVGAVALLAAAARGRKGLVTRKAEEEPEAGKAAEPEAKEDAAEAEQKEDKEIPAEEGEEPAEETPAGEPEEEEDEESAEAEASAEAKSERKPAKWTCSSCGAQNFPQVDECHKCGSRKPSKAEMRLIEERDEAKREVSNIMDSFLRLQADLQNYRRQHNESMERAKELGKQDALRKLVPLMDDISEAVVAPEDLAEEDKSLFDSYSLLFKKVADTYSKFGVEVMETSAGEKYDAFNHKKVEEREPSEEDEPGTICEVLKTGWTVDGKVLLPIEVAVVAAPEAEEEEEEEEQRQWQGHQAGEIEEEEKEDEEDGEAAPEAEEEEEEEEQRQWQWQGLQAGEIEEEEKEDEEDGEAAPEAEEEEEEEEQRQWQWQLQAWEIEEEEKEDEEDGEASDSAEEAASAEDPSEESEPVQEE